MSLYAVDGIDDAVAATRSFVGALGPLGWLKLGAVVLFVGGFGSASFSANLPQGVLDAVPAGESVAALLPDVSLGTAGLVVAVGLTLSAYLMVRSLFEFVFYEALRDGDVQVRQGLRQWWVHGLQLWGFRVTLVWGLLVLGAAAASAVDGGGFATGIVGRTPLATGVVLLGFAAYALLAGLTTRFVVPVMLVEGVGVLRAWRRFLGVVVAHPGQYAAYLLVGLVVRFVADVLALSAAVLFVVALTVPLAILLVPAVVVLTVAPRFAIWPPFLLLSSGLSAAYVLLLVGGALVLRVPFVAFVRYYALAVLAGTGPTLALR